MFATVTRVGFYVCDCDTCWFLACNESNETESNRLICGTESNQIEPVTFLPNLASLVSGMKHKIRTTEYISTYCQSV